MDKPRIYHGKLSPYEFGQSLVAEFNRENLQAHQIGNDKHIIVQIGTRRNRRSGGNTALTVAIRQVEDGVSVQIGEQSLLGVVASLGQTALWTWRNPWNLISRLDDVAQDVENLQLSDEVWEFIEDTAYASGATFELSERLKRLSCSYCDTANPVGAPNCISCGAPLGKSQPSTCSNCGFVIKTGENVCPNCGRKT